MSQFSGTGVALVTPFNTNGEVDYAALEKLVEHVITNGINYLVALGTTAETPTLSADEKKSILTFILDKCNNRVPVVCGIGGNNTAEVIHNLQTYKLDRVAGILSVAPYYNKPTQEGLYQHFKAIANATDKQIILYNVPGRTSSNLLPGTAIRLANDCPNIVAIKEASGNFPQFMELLQYKPANFTVVSGDDNLALPQIAVGMQGVISVAANCYTKDFTQMVRYALNGNYDEARKLHYKLLTGIDLLFVDGNPSGVKTALHQLGICENILRLPLVPATRETQRRIADFMISSGQLPQLAQ
jgi:4-hydroxy-tetrahydrodipicolinate synthase